MGAALATVTLVMTRGGHGSTPPHGPPGIQEPVLFKTMRLAHCGLRAMHRPAGSRVARVSPTIYRSPLRDGERVAALSRRIVVIEYRSDLDRQRVAELGAIQRAAPAGTILAPATSGVTYAVRASAGGLQLRCARASDTALDAIQLFRGRFVGGSRRRG